MIISAKPSPSIGALFSKVEKIDTQQLIFFSHGRYALLECIKNFKLKKGDGIVIPAYMCNSTLEPIRKFGLKIFYVDVNKNLTPSIENIKKISKRETIKALLLVNYFGFELDTEAIFQFCRDNKVKIIEDFSHSFYSNLFTSVDFMKSDAQIFSLRKNLPVQDGGVLKLPDSSHLESNKLSCCNFLDNFLYLTKRLVEFLAISMQFNIYSQRITYLRASKTQSLFFDVKSCMPSWNLLKYIGNKQYLSRSKEITLSNFKELSNVLNQLQFKILKYDLNKDEIPQALVLFNPGGNFLSYLRANGIGAWSWPAEEMPLEVLQDRKNYPNANYFNQSLVLVPIHQSVSKRKIDYIKQVFSRWKN